MKSEDEQINKPKLPSGSYKLNWLAVVALAVAIFGGVPGVIELVEWINREPGMLYLDNGSIMGLYISGPIDDPSGNAHFSLYMKGGITNANRSEALVLRSIEISVLYKNNWIPLQPVEVTDAIKDEFRSFLGKNLEEFETTPLPMNKLIGKDNILNFELVLTSDFIVAKNMNEALQFQQWAKTASPKAKIVGTDQFDKQYAQEFEPHLF